MTCALLEIILDFYGSMEEETLSSCLGQGDASGKASGESSNLCCNTGLYCIELTYGVGSTGIIANKILQCTVCCN